ncbi:MAG: 50S ribosomal protein L4 [Nanoarchaeota archaeon]
MKAVLKTKTGTSNGNVNLPAQFSEEIRPDLIKRAVLAIHSHKRQPHGTDPEAGKKYSSKLSRRRRHYKGAYGIGISRVPRKIMSHRGTRFNWTGATAPNTRGGREAHPPKAEKIIYKNLNRKERRKAIRSALSASVLKELVLKRGHIVEEYPLVLEDSVQELTKTKEVIELLVKLGLSKELERAERKTLNTGKARRRGRAYKKAIGPLIVVSEKCALLESASNIPGVEVVEVKNLNAELLAPGTDCGRLTLYTEGSIKKFLELRLFTDSPVKEEKTTKKPAVKQEKPVKEKKAAAPKKETKPKAAAKKPAKKPTKAAKK